MNCLKYVITATAILVSSSAFTAKAGTVSADLIKLNAYEHPLLISQLNNTPKKKLKNMEAQVVRQVTEDKNGYSVIKATDSNNVQNNYLLRGSDMAVFSITSKKILRPDIVKNDGKLSNTSQAIEVLSSKRIQPAVLNEENSTAYLLTAKQVPIQVVGILPPVTPGKQKMCLTVSIGGSYGSFGSPSTGYLSNVRIGGTPFSGNGLSGTVGLNSAYASDCK